jgi:hypothetical protein
MQATTSLQSWLDHLRSLAPVTGLAHVGAGTGQDAACYANWNIPSTVFIEADENCHEKLAATISGHPDWSVHTALLSDKEQEKDFYLASNPNENGVLQPESLANLWRNLKTKEQCLLNASTLDSLLTKLHAESETINWLVIDCLPALPVLHGAGRRLDACDVIIARVVLDQAQLHAAGTSKAEIDVFLSEHGYRCIAVEEERLPAVGKALYVRDWKTSFTDSQQRWQQVAAIEAKSNDQLQKKMAEQTKLATERQQQVEQLTKASEEQAKLTAERQLQLEQLTKAKDEQTKLATERQQQVAQLTQTCEEQTKLAAERQLQLAQLTKAKDEQTKLATERQQQVAQLTQTCEEQTKLAAERQLQLTQLTKAKDEQTKLATERQQQVAQLMQTRDEQTKLAAEQQTQLEQLIKAKDEQSKLATERQQQVAQLTNASKEQTKLATEQQLQLEQLTKAKDEQTKLATERQQQVAQLTKTKDELTQARDTQSKLAAETKAALDAFKGKETQWTKEKAELISSRDSANHTLVVSQQRVQQLLSEQGETTLLQQRLQEEIAKAENQLELVKELLLQEPGL